MKKGKNLSRMGKILTAAMGLLGLTACETDGPELYGSPTMNYRVLGTVVDEDGNPIQGIKATLKEHGEDVTPATFSRYTDAEGKYGSKDFTEGFPTSSMRVVFEDVDGAANGEFEKDSVMFDDMERRKLEEGMNDWYDGVYEFVANKQLKKKE